MRKSFRKYGNVDGWCECGGIVGRKPGETDDTEKEDKE